MERTGSKIKLIFVTRKVDRGDALAGFVFTWLRALAQEVESLLVICLEQGDTAGLPPNVAVYSMGKEQGESRFRILGNYLRLLLGLLRQADGVFIHMHPVYAIAAWLPAKLYKKKLVLWYTHKSVDLKLRLAHFLVDEVLTASKESFRLPSSKVKIIGHGIDLAKFTPSFISPYPAKRDRGRKSRGGFKIVSVGRISPVKDYETLLKAMKSFKDQGITDIDLEIYGRVGLPEHQSYFDALVTFVHNADLEDIVKFQGELNYEYVDEVYQEADLFVNLSRTGSLDKSVLEAAACGTLVLTSNEAFRRPLLRISPLLYFERDQPAELSEKIRELKELLPEEREHFRQALHAWVEREHNLQSLAKKIVAEFQ